MWVSFLEYYWVVWVSFLGYYTGLCGCPFLDITGLCGCPFLDITGLCGWVLWAVRLLGYRYSYHLAFLDSTGDVRLSKVSI